MGRGGRLLGAGLVGLGIGAGALSATHWTRGPTSSADGGVLRALPLSLVGIAAHYVGSIPIPKTLRSTVYRSYCSSVGCDVEEVAGSLDDFQSLSQFFRRRLREDARPIDLGASLIAPCDGTVIAAGPVGAYGAIQVKNIKYRIRDLLGAGEREPLAETSVAVADRAESGARLWYVVIHIAPGQCHRFVSPASWDAVERRRIQGYLLWLNPDIEGLYTENERLSILGSWDHGLFTMTAVGAAGRGSIVLDNEKQPFQPQLRPRHGDVKRHRYGDAQRLNPGQSLGGFLLGSAVVLVFEAPEESFAFQYEEGDSVKMGEKLATLQAVKTAKSNALVTRKKSHIDRSSGARARFRRAW